MESHSVPYQLLGACSETDVIKYKSPENIGKAAELQQLTVRKNF